MTPKKIDLTTPLELTAEYEPEQIINSGILDLQKSMDIVIYPPPLFIMSPRIKVYDAKSIRYAKGYGYLQKFEITNLPDDDGESQPCAVITVKVEDVK